MLHKRQVRQTRQRIAILAKRHRHEKPYDAWVLGYMQGLAATLPTEDNFVTSNQAERIANMMRRRAPHIRTKRHI